MIVYALIALAPAAVWPQAQDTVRGATVAAGAGVAKNDTASAKADTAASAHPRILMTVEKRGEIVIELLTEQAPKTCERILTLVTSGFYNGLRFHRVESYLVQAGAGESKLAAVEGEMFSQRLSHDAGMVGMARLPDNYDSATTQFYIMKEHRPLLNGEYTLFGRVTRGMDVVNVIKKGDVIKSVAVAKTP
jgi:cyclophilin family peptidyl-prolyl cis-trans isomerase